MISRLVIATHNRKKAGEMVHILSGRFPSLEVKTLADYPGAPEPEETGDTYAENATIKAESAAAFTGEWSLADDAGLEVDALRGAPGVHSKRFEGEDSSFDHKIGRILEMLADVPEEGRGARFRCFIALSEPPPTRPPAPSVCSQGEHVTLFNAICEGRIAAERSGAGGFGYDPIFYLPELNFTMADLTAEQKHEISHRGKVLREFSDWFAERLSL
ncbi:MAG: RdgB/HAM1 family non-canonical purine NTP pyrophosphatase [Chlorobia bacterium]|nr:RdgB/HAM1 family non-canonical purine NTP pyrophosphatase [Fimbriimonadaceae bacterium]